ncbi:MAG: hypothetical protein OXC29_09875 [Rhodococcus sp.]|nr:hypothetical protein [Rhodococcus sp. (in: high G+C Gram-positive bacteria)]
MPLYDMADIARFNEIIAVEAENQRRAAKAAEDKAKRKGQG